MITALLAWFESGPLGRAPRLVQWCFLLAFSAALIAVLKAIHLPAAWLLGAMFAGILVESGGGAVRVPAVPFWFCQAVIGCLIARVITPQILHTFAAHWWLFTGIMLAVIVSCSALGWLLSRLRVFPGTTAVWGLLPGAASVMMLMADAFGADGRLVAFMQYLRVVFVAVAASVIGRFCFHASGSAAPIVWFPAIHGTALLATLLFIALSIILGKKSGLPAGVLLVPLILGTLLKILGVLALELPPWLLASSYILLGWNTGLRFSRDILAHAFRTLPQTIFAVVLLLAICGGLAWALVRLAGVDPLTAYLATSPGGMDTAAIIAASTKVDMPFVMAMQASRFFILLVIGPVLSRWVARQVTDTSILES